MSNLITTAVKQVRLIISIILADNTTDVQAIQFELPVNRCTPGFIAELAAETMSAAGIDWVEYIIHQDPDEEGSLFEELWQAVALPKEAKVVKVWTTDDGEICTDGMPINWLIDQIDEPDPEDRP